MTSTPIARLMTELLCRAAGHTDAPLPDAAETTLHTICGAPYGFRMNADGMLPVDWAALHAEPWSASWSGRTYLPDTNPQGANVSVQLAWSRSSGVVVLTNDNNGDLTYALAQGLHDLIELALDEADSLKFTTALPEEDAA